MEPDSNLFASEAARIVSALTRAFGLRNIALAEDIAQETLASAFETWSFSGVPAHYSALLMAAAKNRAIDVFRRERTARKYESELGRFIDSEWTLRPAVEALFLPDALKDGELRMMFSCCHPRLDEDVQVALILKMLCGFGVDEIAGAFLVSGAAIEKRLSRGKKVLAKSTQLFELTADDFLPRLSAVQHALYLLFSEGYHGASAEAVVRSDLCSEAMRLVRLLVEHAPATTPATRALLALMYLNAARLPGRVDEAGNLRALFDQDRSLWNLRLIEEGMKLLDESATGEELTAYHVEARIAAIHTAAGSAEETRWDEIAAMYDVLMKIAPSPVIALNRAMAIAQHEGTAGGLEAMRAIEGTEKLASYPFYSAALGELELRSGRTSTAQEHFSTARALARNEAERRFLEQRITECARSSDKS